jgi:hypothetical protein
MTWNHQALAVRAVGKPVDMGKSELALRYGRPGNGARLVQRGGAPLERLHPLGERGADAVRLDILAVRRGSGRETFRHPDAPRGKALHHFGRA